MSPEKKTIATFLVHISLAILLT